MFPGGEGNRTLTAGPQRAGYDARVTPAEVAWKLYREGPGRYEAATELARGIAVDGAAPADEVARAGTLLFVAGAYDDASAARLRALEHGAAPQLLAYLDTACMLRTGSGRAARTAPRASPGRRAGPAPHRHAVAGRHRRRTGARVAGRPPRRAVARRRPRCSPHAASGTGRRSARAAPSAPADRRDCRRSCRRIRLHIAPRRIREREDRDLREGGAGSDRRQAARPRHEPPRPLGREHAEPVRPPCHRGRRADQGVRPGGRDQRRAGRPRVGLAHRRQGARPGRRQVGAPRRRGPRRLGRDRHLEGARRRCSSATSTTSSCSASRRPTPSAT